MRPYEKFSPLLVESPSKSFLRLCRVCQPPAGDFNGDGFHFDLKSPKRTPKITLTKCTESVFMRDFLLMRRSSDLIHTLVTKGAPHPSMLGSWKALAGHYIVMKRKGLESDHKMSFFPDGNLQNNWSQLSPIKPQSPRLGEKWARRGCHPKDVTV